MTRWIVTVVALCTLWGIRALAQQPAPSPPPAPQPAPAPPPAGARVTSRLTFQGRQEPSRPTSPRGHRAVGPGVPFLWGWGSRWLEEPPLSAPPPALVDAPAGGVQLDYLPWRASVYLDGTLVGRVDDFNGYYHHLVVTAGPHQVVIIEPGYEPLALDIEVSPGRTTTYRGTLGQRSRR